MTAAQAQSFQVHVLLYIPRTIGFYRRRRKEFIAAHTVHSTEFLCDPFQLLWWCRPFVFRPLCLYCIFDGVRKEKEKNTASRNLLYCDYCTTLMLLNSYLCKSSSPLCITDCSVYVPKDVYFFFGKKEEDERCHNDFHPFPETVTWTHCTFKTLSGCMALYLTISCDKALFLFDPRTVTVPCVDAVLRKRVFDWLYSKVWMLAFFCGKLDEPAIEPEIIDDDLSPTQHRVWTPSPLWLILDVYYCRIDQKNPGGCLSMKCVLKTYGSPWSDRTKHMQYV